MQTDPIVSRLREGPLPDSALAAQLTADAAAVLVAGRRRRTVRWRSALAAVAASVLFLLTPPGQSIARELGELVGIGEPASLPPQEFGDAIERDQPIVIASDYAPDGTRYEVVAGRTVFAERGADEPGDPGGEETCLGLDFPEVPSLSSGVCVGGGDQEPVSGAIEAVGFTDAQSKLGPEARYVFSAVVDPRIERIELTHMDANGQTVHAPADVGTVSEEFAAQIGTDDQVGYAIGFVPDDGLPSMTRRNEPGFLGTLDIVGFDAEGAQVAEYNFGQIYLGTLADRARAQKQSMLSADEAAAFLALCSRAEPKVASGSTCTEAEQAAEADPSIQTAADELKPLITESDGALNLDLPSGDGYSMDSGR